MSRGQRKALWVLIAVASAVSLALLANATASVRSATRSASTASTPHLTIGVGLPLSGADAPYGQDVLHGAQLAAKQASRLIGKTVKVSLNIQDDQEQPAVGSNVAHLLCTKSDVLAVFADFASTVTTSSQPIYHACGLGQVAISSSDALTTHGYRNYFQTSAPNAYMSFAQTQFVKKRLKKVRKVVIIDANDATTRGEADILEKDLKQAHLQVVNRLHVQTGAADFRGALTGALAKKPDLIVADLFYTDLGGVVKQARELGYKGPMLGNDTASTPAFPKLAGSAANGFMFINFGIDPTKAPGGRRFVRDFKKSYHASPDSYAEEAYDSIHAIVAAWKASGFHGSRATIIQKLHSIRITGIEGKISYKANGLLRNPPMSAYRISGSKFVFLSRVGG